MVHRNQKSAGNEEERHSFAFLATFYKNKQMGQCMRFRNLSIWSRLAKPLRIHTQSRDVDESSDQFRPLDQLDTSARIFKHM